MADTTLTGPACEWLLANGTWPDPELDDGKEVREALEAQCFRYPGGRGGGITVDAVTIEWLRLANEENEQALRIIDGNQVPLP